MRLMITILMSGLMTAAAQAEVLKTTAEGFIVRHTANIESDTATVFETMTGKVGQWWSPDHPGHGSGWRFG
jgi:hypothetical protein